MPDMFEVYAKEFEKLTADSLEPATQDFIKRKSNRERVDFDRCSRLFDPDGCTNVI